MTPQVPLAILQVTPLLSLAIAIIALLFSAWQYFDRKATENFLRKSRIIMRLGALREGDIIFEEIELTNEILFRQRYRCVLSNIGYVNEGLIFCDVHNLVQHEVEGEKKLLYETYAGMNPKLIDKDNKKILFPLNIAARDSTTIYIDVGMIVPRQAWKAVAEMVGLGTPIAWQKAEKIFSAAGYPCFGQLAYIETEDADGFSIDKYGCGILYQSFWIRFLKTDDCQVTGEFSLMGCNSNIG